MILVLMVCHNPYFNRWFSAIYPELIKTDAYDSHNPYFNRWFSAIAGKGTLASIIAEVTILILIDGFLQYYNNQSIFYTKRVTILILIDGFLQCIG